MLSPTSTAPFVGIEDAALVLEVPAADVELAVPVPEASDPAVVSIEVLSEVTRMERRKATSNTNPHTHPQAL
jgi:hypothetical protein